MLAQRSERKACAVALSRFSMVQNQFEFQHIRAVANDKLRARQCEDISLKWAGAAPPPLRVVCDEYLPKCHRLNAGVKAPYRKTTLVV